MDGLDRIQVALSQIRQLLLSEPKIRQVLVNDDFDPYSVDVPLVSVAKGHIFLAPVFNTNVEPYNKNTFVTIVIEKTEYDEDTASHSTALTINCFSQTVLWEIAEEKIRPLELSSLIIKKIHNAKLSTSHKLSYIDLDSVVLNENIQGYTIGFFLMDGAGLHEQF